MSHTRGRSDRRPWPQPPKSKEGGMGLSVHPSTSPVVGGDVFLLRCHLAVEMILVSKRTFHIHQLTTPPPIPVTATASAASLDLRCGPVHPPTYIHIHIPRQGVQPSFISRPLTTIGTCQYYCALSVLHPSLESRAASGYNA